MTKGNPRETKVGGARNYGSRNRHRPVTARWTGSKLTVPPADIRELTRLSRSPGIAYRLVVRSRIILSLASGNTERLTAAALRVSRTTVARWRARYEQNGIDGLRRDRAGRGRRPRVSRLSLWTRAADAARDLRTRGERVSLKQIARHIGVSYASLQRCQQALGLSIFEPPASARDRITGTLACSTAAGAQQTKERS